MDFTIWRNIASLWVQIRTAEEVQLTTETIDNIVNETISCRHEEKSIYDELMQDLDMEEDDDGY